MKRILVWLAILQLFAVAQDTNAQENQLNGTWEVVSGRGIAPPDRRFRKPFLFTFGDKSFQSNRDSKPTPIRVDQSVTPWEIDFIVSDKRETVVRPGIFRFDGSELILCWAYKKGTPRPQTFDGKTIGYLRYVLERTDKDGTMPPVRE